jgi:hypothetical protein
MGVITKEMFGRACSTCEFIESFKCWGSPACQWQTVNEGKFLLNTREHTNFESQGRTQHLVKNVTFIDDFDKYEGIQKVTSICFKQLI